MFHVVFDIAIIIINQDSQSHCHLNWSNLVPRAQPLAHPRLLATHVESSVYIYTPPEVVILCRRPHPVLEWGLQQQFHHSSAVINTCNLSSSPCFTCAKLSDDALLKAFHY